MKKTLYLSLLIGCMALTACENMFNKMITYNGNEEEAVLCLNAEILPDAPLKVYLTRSWFFLDSDRFIGNPNYGQTRRGIVGDANVEMQVNGGDWMPLTFVAVNDTTLYNGQHEGKSYYTLSYSLNAGDQVTIRASHPDYKTVTATETVPPQPQFTCVQNDTRNKVLSFTLSVDALPATHDEVIFFSVIAYGQQTDTSSKIVSSNYSTEVYVYDTIVYRNPFVGQRLYSEDFMFSEYNLPRTTHNLYTQNGPLFTSADHFVEPHQLTLLLDLDRINYAGYYYGDVVDTLGRDTTFQYQGMPYGRHICIDSVVVSVYVSNQSYYMYRTTILGRNGTTSAPEISLYDDDGGDDIGDIFEDISEIFDELGTQEGTQVYSNVDGGLGHLSLLNQRKQTLPVHLEWDYNGYSYYD